MNNSMLNMPSPMMRIDYSTADAYIRPQPPKLSFGQKMGRFFGKAFSFLGPIGAAVSAVALPGIGLPIAAGLFGLSRLSQDQLYKSDVKRQIAMASQPQPTSVQFPGLFETSPKEAGAAVTEFIALPSLQPTLQDVIIKRNAAQEEEIHKM